MEEDQEEEKDKITTHAPQSLLAAILDDRGEIRSKSDPESKTEEVTGVQPVEERSSSMELQVVEERTPIAEDVVERSFRDSLEEPSVDQQKDNEGDRTDNEPVQYDKEPDSSHISQTADEPEESKAKELKNSTKRIVVKRPVAARKNKEIVYRQPSNRTYAAMHRTKVKVKQWGDERKVAETARKKGERQQPQNPEGYLDSFGASNDYVADTDWNSLNNSPRDYYGNDFRASSHATYTLGQAMDHPMQARYSDLNTNIHGNYAHPQPYEQREQASYYDRTYHSAVQHPQHSQLPPLQHSFASQSAPPGTYSHLRKPLLYQAECLPEEENHLSSTLSDSEFVETQGQMNKTPNSRLKRKFGSEPCLPYSTSTMLRKDLKPERTSYALGPRQTFDYKPYTLRDYRRVKEVPSSGLGGLGPNTETAEYKEKVHVWVIVHNIHNGELSNILTKYFNDILRNFQ